MDDGGGTRMTPEQEVAHHPHHAHHTGRRWFDLTLALSAMFVSVVSLVVAVRHGQAMDRLVAANSWPFLTYGTDNEGPEGRQRILLKIENAGVGPARIQTFEVWWQGQPVASADELLARCCMSQPHAQLALADVKALNLTVGIVAPGVLRAGDGQNILTLERTEANADVWDRLNTARLNLTMRACYCSVFDECWISNLRETSTTDVATCPAAKVPFVVPERWYKSPSQPAATSN
jgi:hypothetical protein